MRVMEIDQAGDVHVGDTAALGEHEDVAVKLRFEPFHAAAGHGHVPDLDEVDLPGSVVALVRLHRNVLSRSHGQVAGERAVFGKVALDILALVPEGHGDIVKAIV